MDSPPTFEQWFDAQGFRNFDADEFLEYFSRSRNGKLNSEPPRKLWENIIPTLRIVDDLRDYYGRPCVLLSSYRSPSYNRAVGGASKSYHMSFLALDIAISGRRPKDVFTILSLWRRQGKFTGGLGLYTNFAHIDTRGTNATW